MTHESIQDQTQNWAKQREGNIISVQVPARARPTSMQALAREFESRTTSLDDDFLERLLTVLAELPDSNPTFVWKRLLRRDGQLLQKEEDETTLVVDQDWNTGWCILETVVKEEVVSPTELHATAMSCSVFGETTAFVSTTVALSCVALQGCPNPLTRLQKRWRSMVIETLQLFDTLENNNNKIRVWTEHVLPAVGWVAVDILSDRNLRRDCVLFTSQLVALYIKDDVNELVEVLNKYILKDDFGFLYDIATSDSVDAELFSASELGMALLVVAGTSHDKSFASVTPSRKWHLLLPQVNALLLPSQASVLRLAKQTLHTLIAMTDRRTLSMDDGTVVGTCQLICNQVPRDADWYQQVLVPLVQRHQPRAQLLLVQALMRDCPMPALKPKLIDLLRDFVHWEDEFQDVQDETWGFLNRTLQSDDIVQDSEVLVACLGLIQRWKLQHSHEKPAMVFRANLLELQRQAKNRIVEFPSLQLLEHSLDMTFDLLDTK